MEARENMEREVEARGRLEAEGGRVGRRLE